MYDLKSGEGVFKKQDLKRASIGQKIIDRFDYIKINDNNDGYHY